MSTVIDRAAQAMVDYGRPGDSLLELDRHYARIALEAAFIPTDEALTLAVARGLYAKENRCLDGWTFDKECKDASMRDYWLDSARSAIEAIRGHLDERSEQTQP